MKQISKAELIFALTKYYERAAEFPEEFGEGGIPSEDAKTVADILFGTVASVYE